MRINEERISQIPPDSCLLHVYYRGSQQGFGVVGKMHFHPESVNGGRLLIWFIIFPVSRVMLKLL